MHCILEYTLYSYNCNRRPHLLSSGLGRLRYCGKHTPILGVGGGLALGASPHPARLQHPAGSAAGHSMPTSPPASQSILHRVGGISPVNPGLLDACRKVRFRSPPSEVRFPVRTLVPFCESNQTLRSLGSLAKSTIGPVRRLDRTRKTSRLTSRSRLRGSSPSIPVCEKYMHCSRVRLPKLSGIRPCMLEGVLSFEK